MTISTKFIVVDFKTTGFTGVEECISGTVIDQDGNILLDKLIKPKTDQPIAPIEFFHNIDQTQIDENGVNYSDFLDDLQDILANYSTIIMYNAEYDKKFIPPEFLSNKTIYCVMIISVGFINNNPMFQPVGNYLKLNNVAALLDINIFDVDLLTSIGDAELCRRVWVEMTNSKHNLECSFHEIVDQYINFSNQINKE